MKQAFMITDSIYRGGVGEGDDDRKIMGDNGKDIYCIYHKLRLLYDSRIAQKIYHLSNVFYEVCEKIN